MNKNDASGENKNSILVDRLIRIYRRKSLPGPEHYMKILDKVNFILLNEDDGLRPYDSAGFPGGIVYLKEGIPTIVVPDLHARMDFFLSMLLHRDRDGYSALQRLADDRLQVVCVGDGFHAEGRAAERWALAFEEFKKKFKRHKYMDEEMRESLGVMEMVKEVKIAFPGNFHFLKGNHENITNEQGDGNHPFRKFAFEGPMVVSYVEKFYGDEFLESYYEFEKNLPLLAVGKNFLISHAEPMEFYARDDLIEYRNRPDVVEGLTWTANDVADDGSVMQMLNHYLDEEPPNSCYYFGGHRPVVGLYNRRAEGKYIQIHNPNRFVIAVITPDREIQPDEDIIEIESHVGEIIEAG